jgi:uncharacterized membrane protein
MSNLFIAVFIFLISHIVPSYAPLRHAFVQKMGERLFMSLYGILSLFLFIWVILAYQQAPYMELWPVANWMKAVPLFIMFWVCLLLVCAFSQPNPFSIGIGAKNFDPQNPGIISLTKHPAFVAFALWSGAHIIPNGDVASLIFFSVMFALSLYGPRSLNQKRQHQLGLQRWNELKLSIAHKLPTIGWWRWVLSILLYMGLLHLHGRLIGVVPYWW